MARGRAMVAGGRKMIEGIFHVNVNVSNFERSLEFYKMLGFRVVLDLKEGGNERLSRGLKLDNCVGRAVLMMAGDEKRATRLDLIEWKNPPAHGRPYGDLAHVGIARIALRTRNLRETYETLKANGVKFFSEPQVFDTKRGRESFVCFTDPDGTVLELIEFAPTGS
jgi:catechol 2,3-dioxygenase-like lactoylglutathione lyase family enzyme